MDDARPRIVRLDLRLRPGSGREARWRRVRPGMTLADLARLDIERGEIRYLVGRGCVEFAPPLPPPGSRAPNEPGGTLRWDRPARESRARACLRCRRPFLSAGPGNRLCEPCRERAGDVSPLEPI